MNPLANYRIFSRPFPHAVLPSLPQRDVVATDSAPFRWHPYAMETLALNADDLVGSFRTFGELGPLYKVLRKAEDAKVHIVVVETGQGGRGSGLAI